MRKRLHLEFPQVKRMDPRREPGVRRISAPQQLEVLPSNMSRAMAIKRMVGRCPPRKRPSDESPPNLSGRYHSLGLCSPAPTRRRGGYFNCKWCGPVMGSLEERGFRLPVRAYVSMIRAELLSRWRVTYSDSAASVRGLEGTTTDIRLPSALRLLPTGHRPRSIYIRNV